MKKSGMFFLTHDGSSMAATSFLLNRRIWEPRSHNRWGGYVLIGGKNLYELEEFLFVFASLVIISLLRQPRCMRTFCRTSCIFYTDCFGGIDYMLVVDFY